MPKGWPTRPGSRYHQPPEGRRTLLDVARDHAALMVTCRRCKHRGVLYPHHLAVDLGRDFPVDQIARRLRCTECRAKGAATVYEGTR
jgi:hypothetical protein